MFKDVKDFSPDELKNLPKEHFIAWLNRPNTKDINLARNGMYFRSFLLACAVLNNIFGSWGNVFILIFALACYEFAYYQLIKEKCEREYNEKMSEYLKKAEKLDGQIELKKY